MPRPLEGQGWPCCLCRELDKTMLGAWLLRSGFGLLVLRSGGCAEPWELSRFLWVPLTGFQMQSTAD